MYAVEIKGLSFSYLVLLLLLLLVNIKKGEPILITGRSESGKSTKSASKYLVYQKETV
jgi:ABC-type bacteriocin/lantibiotic exporter with double-glycine peptidase domain